MKKEIYQHHHQPDFQQQHQQHQQQQQQQQQQKEQTYLNIGMIRIDDETVIIECRDIKRY